MSRLHTRPIRVVIADSEGLFRAGLRALFDDEADIDVVGELPDGRWVGEVVREKEPDILLLDLELPHQDGVEVLRELRGNESPVRPIILTELRDRAKLSLALRLGAKGIVDKKGATHHLMNAIRLVHQGVRWLDPHLGIRESNGLHALSRSASSRQAPSIEDAYPTDWSRLTPREQEVARLVAEGHRYRQVAHLLEISKHTLKNHLRNIFDKLHIRTRVQLAVYSAHNKL